jgi:hypothetical protein
MRFLVLAVTFLSLSGAAFGQRRSGQYWSLGGYGNVLFPGTGHAPPTPPGGITGPHFPRSPLTAATDLQPRPNAILPSPVYDVGYTDDRSGSLAQGDPDQALPVINSSTVPAVIINQSLVPPQGILPTGDHNTRDGAQPCANPQRDALRSQVAVNADRPTIYLIAFRDHRIVQALGYWLDAATLHYISAEYGLNQVSMVLIDPDLSQRLNDERGIAFKLPAPK